MSTINILKGLVGLQDLARGGGTYQRLKSNGETQTLNKLDLWQENVWNLTRYGAKTTASDNSSAIADAVEEATEKGGTILIPPSKIGYDFGTTFTLPKNSYIAVAGYGAETSILNYYGTGHGFTQEGDATGQNKGTILRDFTLYNRSDGVNGFNIPYASFTPVYQGLQAVNFIKGYAWELLENALVSGCRAELGVGASQRGTHGFCVANANGCTFVAIQTHNPGARNGTDGSIGLYAANIDGLYVDGTFEGGAENCDIGIKLEEAISRVTPTGGARLHFYIERCTYGVVLRGHSSSTPLRGIALEGKITGTNIATSSNTWGIWMENYVQDVHKSGPLRISVVGSTTKAVRTDSTCSNIDIGHNSYRLDSDNTDPIEDNQTHPPIKPSTWYHVDQSTELVNETNIVASTSLATVTISSITGDYRPAIAVKLRVKLTVNSNLAVSGERLYVFLRRLGGGVLNDFYPINIYGGTVVDGQIIYEQVELMLDSSSKFEWRVVMITGSFDVDLEIREIAKMV